MSTDWSDNEVDLIVKDYFSMLEKELKGILYSKTEHRIRLHRFLPKRSMGSIEFKHQNITAVLQIMGLPYIKGYKARYNYQNLLAKRVINQLSTNSSHLDASFYSFSDAAPVIHKRLDFTNVIEEAPKPTLNKQIDKAYIPVKINYLEREQNNAKLGKYGEQFVIDFERWRLRDVGKESLADKIEWISRDKGDGAGFDILSKNENGTDRYIEVKTTKLAKETPIFISRKELEFSNTYSKNYYLYRVFDFSKNPRVFIKQGSFPSYCELQAQSYRGLF